MQEGAQQTVQERPQQEAALPQPDADPSNSPEGKKKRGRRKKEATKESPEAATSKARAQRGTRKVTGETERLVIDRFKNSLAKQRTEQEANKVLERPPVLSD